MVKKTHKSEEHFIENFGDFFETYLQLPRISGRIFGYLMIDKKVGRNANEIISKLGVAKSSVSTMVKILIQANYIEIVRAPGEKVRCFKIKDGAWENILLKSLSALSAAQDLIGSGGSFLKSGKKDAQKPLKEIGGIYDKLKKLSEKKT